MIEKIKRIFGIFSVIYMFLLCGIAVNLHVMKEIGEPVDTTLIDTLGWITFFVVFIIFIIFLIKIKKKKLIINSD